MSRAQVATKSRGGNRGRRTGKRSLPSPQNGLELESETEVMEDSFECHENGKNWKEEDSMMVSDDQETESEVGRDIDETKDANKKNESNCNSHKNNKHSKNSTNSVKNGKVRRGRRSNKSSASIIKKYILKNEEYGQNMINELFEECIEKKVKKGHERRRIKKGGTVLYKPRKDSNGVHNTSYVVDGWISEVHYGRRNEMYCDDIYMNFDRTEMQTKEKNLVENSMITLTVTWKENKLIKSEKVNLNSKRIVLLDRDELKRLAIYLSEKSK